jgi:hypothetical protein
MSSTLLRKEGKHHTFDDLEFWAEDGIVCIVDTRDGSCNAVTRKDFVKRASAIYDESQRSKYASDKKKLQDLIISMHEVWKEANTQGDPADVNVVKHRLKESRKAILVTGFNRW